MIRSVEVGYAKREGHERNLPWTQTEETQFKFNLFNLEEVESKESDIEEDTIYQTMLDIQMRHDDSRAFFDNKMRGEPNETFLKNPPFKIIRKVHFRSSRASLHNYKDNHTSTFPSC